MLQLEKKHYKTVHIIKNDKFINDYYKFINDHFSSKDHLFIYVVGESENKFSIPNADNVININNQHKGILKTFRLSKILKPYCDNAGKIIFHGFYAKDIVRFLFLNQYLLVKSYWVMWGVDLYNHSLKHVSFKSFFTCFLAKKLKGRFIGYITYIPGDYELAKKSYDVAGKYHECIMYPSNLYKELILPNISRNEITVMVGNSADPTNNHEEILNKLVKLEDQNFKIICPLSYGNKEYANMIILLGNEMFGQRFQALTDFMVFDEYLKLLAEVDIAIFAHKRQQAMGNTITLLGLGKKVYMRNDVTPFSLFKQLNIEVFDIEDLDLEPISSDLSDKNIENIKSYFSEENLVKQLHHIFEG